MLQGHIAYSGGLSNDCTRKLSRSSLTLVQDVIEALSSLSNALGDLTRSRTGLSQ